ncbi:hypothetical protein VHEMI08731 [[Torrubiella] hemipterigena]|uniref:Arrestin-like N-terminal domain-containing protein n=1 Tax=[Torrubiella] hemipterigena TaxID=1531966 RepID=A0A0A1TP20_9HYPO|nr:hypothetical protein VHEMI08731 [[Torrubiella] hemipterigena]
MSIRVDLENQPPFYTNLDTIKGQLTLHLNRAEQVGSIVVKLEGEAVTRPQVRDIWGPDGTQKDESLTTSTMATETHKILYKIQQVFPDEYHSSDNSPYGSYPLQPGQHTFPFNFKIPINNLCSDQDAMMSLGIASVGNIGNTGLFGSRGARVMDGTRQLYLRHVTQTLPPTFRNLNDECEIRYYIKVTVQRPGFLKENWRYLVNFRFMPIEPPRQPRSGQEAYARRPFTFKPTLLSDAKRRGSLLPNSKSDKGGSASSDENTMPQSIELSARLPHPSILTCNKPLPLRLITKRLVSNSDMVYMTSLQIFLIGSTTVRAQNAVNEKSNRWVVFSAADLNVPVLTQNNVAIGTEYVIPDELWKQKPLPNTVPPSFICCNITQKYSLQIQVSLRLGNGGKNGKGTGEIITLPLNFSNVDVYSGVPPPRELANAAVNAQPPLPPRTSVSGASTAGPSNGPPLPLRPHQTNQVYQQPTVSDSPGEFLDAPPSYSEAMAAGASSPFASEEQRPPYSGPPPSNTSGPMPPEKN